MDIARRLHFVEQSLRNVKPGCGCHASVNGQHLAGHDIELCSLHAAAPALLEALKGVVKVNTRIQEPKAFENVDDWIVVSRAAFDAARAAIAQAKGGQP